MNNLGIICRSDITGLGNQTKNLVKMLKPNKIMVINSTPFNNNKQYYDTYDGFNAFKIDGFASNIQVRKFINGLDKVLTCETFYNNNFINIANNVGVKTYNQYNWEFLDNLLHPNWPIPTKFLAPSYWMLKEANDIFNNVTYLPPPINSILFKDSRDVNFSRNGKKFLHVVGRPAIHDRNGTQDLIDSLKYTKSNFELVIKSQVDFNSLGIEMDDTRITLDCSDTLDETELYRDFDAMILPRKFGGLCLPMNEALISGLPVIMTDISPNNKILPKEWLVESTKEGEFMTRTMIDYHSIDKIKLAEKIDWLCNINIGIEKIKAFEIGYNNYSTDILRPRYEKVLQ